MKPDYILQLERKLLGWIIGSIATFILGFVSLMLTTVINFNRLEVRFNDHEEGNKTMFQEVQNRLSNDELLIYKPLTGTIYESFKKQNLSIKH